MHRNIQGRYLFLKGSLHNRPITIANIYAPNTQQVPFFRTTFHQLTAFQSGTLIVGGGFNVPLTPALDTSNGSSCLPYRALHAIKSQFQTLTFHDTWRMLYPNVKDFTFFSPPHTKYSRIDHFFITQDYLTSLIGATIEPKLLSDHHPITITLALPQTHNRSMIWGLDDSLLLDLENTQNLSKCLSQYFKEKDTGDTSPTVTWAAHKCIIRGVLISLSAKRNRLRKARVEEISARIKSLERAHKLSLATSCLNDLLKAREELLEELQRR